MISKKLREICSSLFRGKSPATSFKSAAIQFPIEGLFFATSINEKVKFVERFHLPLNLVYAVSLDEPIFADDCRLLFPGSTNHKPAFWKD